MVEVEEMSIADVSECLCDQLLGCDLNGINDDSFQGESLFLKMTSR